MTPGGQLGAILAPGGGAAAAPPGVTWCADNGVYGKGWPGEGAWWAWLTDRAARNAPDLCAFAVAPDVVADHAETLTRSTPWLPRIRELGVPAAFVAQNGATPDDLPWGAFDVLFIGGDTTWKLGPSALACTAAARAAGLPVHMGRVNSERRLRYAAATGCTSADGTFVTFGPDVNAPQLLGWLRGVDPATVHALPGL